MGIPDKVFQHAMYMTAPSRGSAKSERSTPILSDYSPDLKHSQFAVAEVDDRRAATGGW